MATYTSRMSLIKPAGSEPRAVGPIASDMDLIDKFMPCILVNDGVTPPTVDLYDGALVKERTSGIIWEARKNGGGTYDKVYVRYPYQLYTFGQEAAVANVTTTKIPLAAANFNAAKSTNASTSQINGSSEFVIPVKGIWQINMHWSFDSNATGFRSANYYLNGVLKNGDSEEVAISAVNGTNTRYVNVINDLFSSGDTIVPSCFQTSGGALIVTCFFVATLNQTVQ